MLRLLTRRRFLRLVVMWVVSMLLFASTEILPGDVAQAVLGQGDTLLHGAKVQALADPTAQAMLNSMPVLAGTVCTSSRDGPSPIPQ